MPKIIPVLKTDKQVEGFVDRADLSAYNLSKFKPTIFAFAAKNQRLNVRLPLSMLDDVKEK